MYSKILQSADDAPPGSVILPKADPLTIRYPDGRGWHLLSTACDPTRHGWEWHEHDITGPVQLLAEGLTDDECRALSGMSADQATLWCERRAEVTLQDNPCAEALRLLGWNGEGDPREWAKEMVADRRREFFRALDDRETSLDIKMSKLGSATREGVARDLAEVMRHQSAFSEADAERIVNTLTGWARIGHDIGTDGWRRGQALYADRMRPRQDDIGWRANSGNTYNAGTTPRIDIQAFDETIKDAATRRLDAIEKMLRTLLPGQSLAVHDGQHDDTRMEMLVLRTGECPPPGKTWTVYGPAPHGVCRHCGHHVAADGCACAWCACSGIG